MPVLGWETAGVRAATTGAAPTTTRSRSRPSQAKARTTLGLSAEHALSPNWTIGAKVNNLTNSRTPEVLGYTPPPRDVLVTLRGTWCGPALTR